MNATVFPASVWWMLYSSGYTMTVFTEIGPTYVYSALGLRVSMEEEIYLPTPLTFELRILPRTSFIKTKWARPDSITVNQSELICRLSKTKRTTTYFKFLLQRLPYWKLYIHVNDIGACQTRAAHLYSRQDSAIVEGVGDYLVQINCRFQDNEVDGIRGRGGESIYCRCHNVTWVSAGLGYVFPLALVRDGEWMGTYHCVFLETGQTY